MHRVAVPGGHGLKKMRKSQARSRVASEDTKSHGPRETGLWQSVFAAQGGPNVAHTLNCPAPAREMREEERRATAAPPGPRPKGKREDEGEIQLGNPKCENSKFH